MLSVNPKKTRIVIFQKKCRKSSLDKYYFHINDNKIDIVDNYTCLRIHFLANGNFRDCKASLKDKTLRIHFAARCYLDFSKLSLDVTKRLFDSFFLILL